MSETFWLGLLLKIAMTASIVVAASVVVERSGPFIGALIAALPTAGGAAYIILAIEHPPAFIAQSTVGSLVSNAVCLFFALAFAVLAQKRSLLVSLGGAYLLWFCLAAATRFVEWTMPLAAALNVVAYPVTIWAGTQFRAEGARNKVKNTVYDIAWRAAVVTACVVAVTAASSSIGSFWSGIFAFFPVAMGSFFLILYLRVGGPTAASVAAHVQVPLIGLGLGLVAVHYLAEPAGVWRSYLACLSISLGWNALLWFARNRRRALAAPQN
ncbi:MAG: hypothetical protein JO205_13650 [Pseudolabrys sp.]|nr:hypothetical protein [Pseudolabrys sp.]MBV9262405.1 hypothetical protein [Pseudolabrys sp.]